MSRTKRSTLDYLAGQLNARLGRPQYDWYQFGGKNICRVGALTLDHDGTGYRLMEVLSGGGGLREVSPRLPAGQMEDYLRAMHTGLDFVESAGKIQPWDPTEEHA